MKKSFLFSLIIFSTIFYLFAYLVIGQDRLKSFKNIINLKQQQIVKKYFFPYYYINQLENNNENLKKMNNLVVPYEVDLDIKKLLKDLNYFYLDERNLGYKNLKIKKYNNSKPFLMGINNTMPGSAYLDIFQNNLFLASSIGITGYGEINNDKIIFKQIKNNVGDFINKDQFKKSHRFSIKDLKILDNKIYLSLTKEVVKNCWNTWIIFSEINLKELKFEKLFSPSECVKEVNEDGEFHPHQSGGKIIALNNKQIAFSTGDYRLRSLAQDESSVNGKILSINIINRSFELLSIGHRNPQGLYYDEDFDYILSTEHGPKGGDEINLIKLNQKEIPNYGWPVASYGEHYGYKSDNIEKYKKYPLLKSHAESGYMEPLKYFSPSIAISEIVGIGKKQYVVSSMKDKSLYFFNLNENNEIKTFDRVEIGERIRDLIVFKKRLVLFLEDSGSIGIIDLD